MILYFSGTGNSRYIAKMLAKVTEDKLVSMNTLIKTGNKESQRSEKPFVFVCPVYGGRIPPIVDTYIRQTQFEGTKKVYFIVSCALSPWITVTYTEKLCSEKGFQLLGFHSVIMPQGYVAMGTTQSAEESNQIVQNAIPKINSIAERIAAETNLEKEEPGKAMMSKVINPIMRTFMIKAKDFYSTDKCIGCGTCVERCPLNNVTLVDGKPKWGKTCTHCMACIAGCPTEAIEYGKKSVGAPRYYNTQEPQL